MRDAVSKLLPSWTKQETDTAGNLWVKVGTGDPLVVFVAHMDEIGFRVDSIREDGTLALTMRGGFFPSLFEGKPALVHGPILQLQNVLKSKSGLKHRLTFRFFMTTNTARRS